MVQTFSDDFQRADGPVGNGWTVVGNGISISGGKVVTTQFGNIWRDDAIGTGYQDVSLDSIKSNTTGASTWLYAKLEPASRNGYSFNLQAQGANSYAQLWRLVGGGQQSLGQTLIGVSAQGTHRLRVVFNAGLISCYVDGTLAHSATDNTWAANHGYGFRLGGSTVQCDNFNATDAPLTALDAEPEPIVQAAVPQTLTFTGTGTAWEPGTPGVPTFQVDKGTLANQSIQSATQASADYTPPQADDVARFTDPSTGNYDDVPLSTGFQVEAGGDNSDVLAVLGDPAPEQDIVAWLAKIHKVVWPKPGQTMPSGLMDYVFSLDMSVPALTLAVQVADAHQQTTDENEGLWSLLYTLAGLCGNHLNLGIDTNAELHSLTTNAHYTLLDVMNTLRGISVIDNTNLWDYLHDLRTVNGYTLGDVLLMEPNIRGLDNRNLTQLYDLVNGLDLADLTTVLNILTNLTEQNTLTVRTVLDRIDELNDAPPTDLTGVLAAIAALGVALAALDSSMDSWFETIRGAPGYNLQQIKDQLDYLADYVTDHVPTMEQQLTDIHNHLHNLTIPPAQGGAPVWPGLAGVTLGAPVALATGFQVDGPLDGLLIDITGVPPYTGSYTFNGVKSHTHVGAVAFVSDRGDVEPPQTFGFEKAIITPRCMTRAASAICRAKQALTGTARPWTVNP